MAERDVAGGYDEKRRGGRRVEAEHILSLKDCADCLVARVLEILRRKIALDSSEVPMEAFRPVFLDTPTAVHATGAARDASTCLASTRHA